VLNGDIFDFDLVTSVPKDPPWPVSFSSGASACSPPPPKSAWKLSRMLEHTRSSSRSWRSSRRAVIG